MSKQPPPAPTASAIGPCPTIIQIVGRPGTGSLPRTIAPPDQPREHFNGADLLLTCVRDTRKIYSYNWIAARLTRSAAVSRNRKIEI